MGIADRTVTDHHRDRDNATGIGNNVTEIGNYASGIGNISAKVIQC